MTTRPETSSPLPSLPDYNLGERLGAGRYGTVYKARHISSISTSRPSSAASMTSLRPFSASIQFYAVKCIYRKNLNKLTEELFINEIKLLKDLKHENIVEMYDFRCDENYIYIIMEYCSGGDLSMFIRSKQKLSEAYARIFLRQLAKVLKFLHERQISHMDLKPGNILLKSLERPVLKVADFGVAQHIGKEGSKSVRGTPMYMAPEIINTNNPYDNRVDLWSIGVILYECLFGRPPFVFLTTDELIDQIISNVPIEIPTDPPISADCRNLLERLLRRDPNERISFEDFFQHPFIYDHITSQIQEADEILQQAIHFEQTGDLKSALEYRLRALEEYASLRRIDNDPERRQLLRLKINQGTAVAENLRKRVREPQESPITMTTTTTTTMTTMVSPPSPSLSPPNEYLNSDKELSEAYQHCLNGNQYMNSFVYAKACEEYELGLSVMLRTAKNETDRDKIKILHNVISHYLTKAESCKKRLETQRWEQQLEKIKKDSIVDQPSRKSFSMSHPTCRLQ